MQDTITITYTDQETQEVRTMTFPLLHAALHATAIRRVMGYRKPSELCDALASDHLSGKTLEEIAAGVEALGVPCSSARIESLIRQSPLYIRTKLFEKLCPTCKERIENGELKAQDFTIEGSAKERGLTCEPCIGLFNTGRRIYKRYTNAQGEERWLLTKTENGRMKQKAMWAQLGVSNRDEFRELLKVKYLEGMSAPEVSEWLEERTGIPYGVRSVQRHIEVLGVTRPIGDAFRNAIARGRVRWDLVEWKQWREEGRAKQLSPGLRMRVLTRDQFACQLCGMGREDGVKIHVDHIVAKVHGGSDDEDNLRALCIDCNLGKRIVDAESAERA